ncbi:MAG: aminotransferase class V-fold PLP-dependent enzyme [Egibacteraceae bacterium]
MARTPIYLDHASTSYPKPDAVWHAARDYLTDLGVSPGRGGYRSARAADLLVEQTRAMLATLLGAADPSRVAFAANATHALNVAIIGTVSPGDHVVTTNTEHNSVLRPLEALARAGVISYTVVDVAEDGVLDLDRFRGALRPTTRLVVVNHASNVTGAVAPVRELSAIAREAEAMFLLDASQTLGLLDIDVDALGVDIVAFTGHKCLRGPSGTGGLYVRDPSRVRPLMRGGTGSASHVLTHPAAMPAKFEAGTSNYLGIAGLKAAVELLLAEGVSTVRQREQRMFTLCLSRLREIDGLIMHHVHPALPRVPVVSINVAHLYPSELSAVLDDDFGIMTRAGIHCAPLIHRSLGTAPHGTVRVSLGSSTTTFDIEALVEALTTIAMRAPLRQPA